MEYQPLMRDLPMAERPRERLLAQGGQDLSNAELVAIVLRTGSTAENALALATRLLASHGGLAGLARATAGELATVKGIGEAKAAQVVASLESGRRLHALQPQKRPQVKSPQDVANLLQAEMVYLDQEHLRVVLLNTKNQVLSVQQIYRGNVSASLVRVSEIFRTAVRENCPAIIVVHNHPSGDPTPSNEDAEITRQIVEAGGLLHIELLDHIIIAQQGFISLKEKGLGFPTAPGG
ncbi:MAG: DNA repair protein RadC [Dehalococcoidia bacterium]|jgi:DNA repair protein RadC|nr:DNA repair protein RadC [Dehalococcoidia bacterium]